ncbi:MAG: AmmeMemoRadiSam system radical SAM enzyme [Candidatus Diapherotrites archaeon]|nr:AmmeMemoRadiSam system radical SAM enzyme [Candidatus Diapherotrites archaeon]
MGELHEAGFYKKLKDKTVQCFLCRRECVITEGSKGACGVRKNLDGKLYSLVYGRTLTMSIDPIEKKPLYHFKPGTQCLGISTFGCNFFCGHCQNADISQQRSEDAIAKVPFTSPQEIVEQTLAAGVEGIAYTYTEPTIFAEYALDTMKIAKKKGLYNVWVSNGYMGKECIETIAPFLDAINVDLKGNAKFYQEVCGNVNIDFVKENIQLLHKKKAHVEIACLIIPGYNDTEQDFKETAEFLVSVDPLMPVHFSRFWPQYKMQHLPPTDTAKLRRVREVALKAGLKYVYLGNVTEEEPTRCPKCHSVLVKRFGMAAEVVGVGKGGNCKKCGAKAGFII